jgi:CRISPR-associated protein Csa1
MELGLRVHEVFHRAAGDVRRLLARGLKPWEVSYRLYKRSWNAFRERWEQELYRILVTIWCGEAASAEAYYGGEGLGWLPWLSEYRIDGTPLGLSKSLRADAIGEGGIVAEIKLGRPAHWHRLSIAGYALALESYLEAPIDYGVLIWVNGVPDGSPKISFEPVYVSPSLREEFLSVRDEAIEVLLSDEEPPEMCR